MAKKKRQVKQPAEPANKGAQQPKLTAATVACGISLIGITCSLNGTVITLPALSESAS